MPAAPLNPPPRPARRVVFLFLRRSVIRPLTQAFRRTFNFTLATVDDSEGCRCSSSCLLRRRRVLIEGSSRTSLEVLPACLPAGVSHETGFGLRFGEGSLLVRATSFFHS